MELKGKGANDIYNGIDSKAARALLPSTLHAVAARKLVQLEAAESLADLASPPSNRLERLHGDREGQLSIRINEKYRVCFRWENNQAEDVEIVDYH